MNSFIYDLFLSMCVWSGLRRTEEFHPHHNLSGKVSRIPVDRLFTWRTSRVQSWCGGSGSLGPPAVMDLFQARPIRRSPEEDPGCTAVILSPSSHKASISAVISSFINSCLWFKCSSSPRGLQVCSHPVGLKSCDFCTFLFSSQQ